MTEEMSPDPRLMKPTPDERDASLEHESVRVNHVSPCDVMYSKECDTHTHMMHPSQTLTLTYTHTSVHTHTCPCMNMSYIQGLLLSLVGGFRVIS